jgi:hypothetical protein
MDSLNHEPTPSATASFQTGSETNGGDSRPLVPMADFREIIDFIAKICGLQRPMRQHPGAVV